MTQPDSPTKNAHGGGARRRVPGRLRRGGAIAIVAAVAAVGVALPAQASSRGVVTAEALIEILGEDRIQVEVSIGKPLLALVAAPFKQEDPEIADSILDLERVYAAVLDLEGEAETGRSFLNETASMLRRGGWDRVARVNDETTWMSVYVLATEERVDGLTVMIHEKSAGELIFVNLAGLIDIERIEALGEALDLPPVLDGADGVVGN